MTSWFIQKFGLKGSFQWALRQMEKGETVMRPQTKRPFVIFRANPSHALNGEMRIMWSASDGSFANRWNSAGFSVEELEATDWRLFN